MGDARPARDGFTCPAYGQFIVTAVEGIWTTPTVGSPRRFCTPACRQAAYRWRRAGPPEGGCPESRGTSVAARW